MKTIAPFINAGWNTVPLRGELKRLEDGSKTIPKFEKDWKAKYTATKNELASKIGGAMTGEVSGIIAIDCDNTVTYTLFKSLDPDYRFEFVSQGKKDMTCGTIIYSYDEDFADSFSINDGSLALDFYSTNGFIYLPTEANESKVAWHGKLPALKPMPDATKALLKQLQKPPAAQAELPSTNIMTAACLAPLVKQFTTDRKFMPGLFKIITPKAFRTEAQYIKEGYLHPNNVPQGRGSEYLSKVSAILGTDISIDETLYVSALHDINDLFDEPMDATRLDKTIAEPMMSGKATIDNKSIWQYDENWAKYRLILHTKRQSSIELGFDDRRNIYYCVDTANEHVKCFSRDSEYIAYLQSVAINVPQRAELKMSLPMINVSSEPNRPFGFYAGSDPTARTLNTFIRTPELSIIEDPESYHGLYRKPQTTLKFLETLVPEQHMREFLLKFLKRKFKTFEYSPVTLYFLGVHGSGKDTFVSIVEKIMGKVAKPTTREFLEMFNGWLLDSYFVQLDEYGNQLTTMKDRDEALGKLKAYTGKRNVQIRQMRTDGFQYNHNATFISTANTNPFGIEDGDRRIALFNTPNVLTQQDWVHDVTEVHSKILNETKDFCYYLATEVEDLAGTEYQLPPTSAGKNTLIADNMYAAQRLAFALKNGMVDYIKTLAKDHGCKNVVTALNRGRLRADDLSDLYDELTHYKGEMRSLNKAIRQAGIELKATTHEGKKDYYYNLDYLEESPFEADDDEEDV